MSYLKAQAAVDAAAKLHDKARAAAKQAPGDKEKAEAVKRASKALTAAYDAVISATENESSLRAQHRAAVEARVIHHMKHEEKTVETDDPPKSSKPAASGPPASGGADSSADSAPATQDSARPSAAAPSKPAPKMKGAKKAGASEEEEEKALAADFDRANASYLRGARSRGADAYGLRGPKALLEAVMAALGTSSIGETFGALKELPERLKATDETQTRLAALETNDRKSRVEALVQKAKAEGRTRGSEHRAALRAFGAKHGTAELRGMIAMLPAKRTTGQGFLEPKDGAEAQGMAQFDGGVSEEDMARMTQGMKPADAAEFKVNFFAALAKNGGGVPKV